MRRVCFFSGNIGRSGGTERVTTVVASALAEQGMEVSILSLVHGEKSPFPLHPAVCLHSLHMERHSANFSDIRIWSRLRKFLRRQAIERIVDVDTANSWYSIPAAWGTDAKVVDVAWNISTSCQSTWAAGRSACADSLAVDWRPAGRRRW